MEQALISSNSKKSNNSKLPKKYMYILYFFLFSCLGWILETLYSFVVLGHFTNRGFLYGPICPIYGFGALILIIFLGRYKNKALKLFTYSAIVFSIFEYFVSYMLEALFQTYWWDYSNDFFNLNGRISLFYSFTWGIIAIIFCGYIYPFFKKKLNTILSKIPYKLKTSTLNLLVIAWIVDTVFSFINYL